MSVVGHTEQTLHKIAVSALQPSLLPPFPPHKEILTFPEIRNLPEGRGLILWTCHVPQLRCRILVKQISFVADVALTMKHGSNVYFIVREKFDPLKFLSFIVSYFSRCISFRGCLKLYTEKSSFNIFHVYLDIYLRSWCLEFVSPCSLETMIPVQVECQELVLDISLYSFDADSALHEPPGEGPEGAIKPEVFPARCDS